MTTLIDLKRKQQAVLESIEHLKYGKSIEDAYEQGQWYFCRFVLEDAGVSPSYETLENEIETAITNRPDLSGSSKQVKWAEDIRDEQMSEIRNLISDQVFEKSAKVMRTEKDADPIRLKNAMLAVISQPEAKYWIDTRSKKARELIKEKYNEIPSMSKTDAQKAVFDAIRSLANVDDGAIAKDRQGFNKFDTATGNELALIDPDTASPSQIARAASLILKYKKQIPESAFTAAKDFLKTDEGMEELKKMLVPISEGSPKQIAWAEKIRAEYIRAINNKKAEWYNDENLSPVKTEQAVYNLLNNTSSKFWIDNRDESATNLFLKEVKKLPDDMQAVTPEQASVPSAADETILYSTDKDGITVTVKIAEGKVFLTTPGRNDKFISIAKDNGYRWEPMLSAWSRTAHSPKDRAAEVSISLRNAGFHIKAQDTEIREMVRTGVFAEEKTRFLKVRTTGDYAGWFAFMFPKDETISGELKKASACRWDSPSWLIPQSDYRIASAVAERFGFEISEKATAHIEEAKTKESEKQAEHAKNIEASRAQDADVNIPAPEGLSYLPYQKAGIAYGTKKSGVLIADEMGLGKTIQAIGIANNLPEKPENILIICPASLRPNWKKEFSKWTVHKDITVGIAEGSSFPDTGVVIINYDILTKHPEKLRQKTWDLLIIDEAHYLKNEKSLRTKQVFGDTKKNITPIRAKKKVYLTGTPILNRPIEAFTLLHDLAPQEFPSWMGYAKRYCAAKKEKFGWNVSGSSNLAELQEKLRSTIMVRRLKKDVLKELPDKQRQVIELSKKGCEKQIKEEMEAWEYHQKIIEFLAQSVEKAKQSGIGYETAVSALANAKRVAFTEMAKKRKETAIAKLPYVIQFLKDMLESGQKVVCFAHHKEVIKALQSEFPNSVSVTGETPMNARQQAVEDFQGKPEVSLFIGNIKAAGVGLTLTASSNVVFAEIDWTPGNMSQAEDRCHRIGQKNSVFVQHLVLEGSLDKIISEKIVEKQAVITSALDDTSIFSDIMGDESAENEVTDQSVFDYKTAVMQAKTVDDIAAAFKTVFRGDYGN